MQYVERAAAEVRRVLAAQIRRTAERRKADAVYNLGSRMMSNGQRTARCGAPGDHGARFGLVYVKFEQRARIDVNRLSARHDCVREAPCRLHGSSGEAGSA